MVLQILTAGLARRAEAKSKKPGGHLLVASWLFLFEFGSPLRSSRAPAQSEPAAVFRARSPHALGELRYILSPAQVAFSFVRGAPMAQSLRPFGHIHAKIAQPLRAVTKWPCAACRLETAATMIQSTIDSCINNVLSEA